MRGHTRIGVAALACTAMFAVGVTSTSAAPKPKRCQGALVALKVQGAERYGLELFAWELCGTKKGQGIPFG